MHYKRIHWRIALPFGMLITLILVGLAIYFSSLLERTYEDELQSRLLAEARLIGAHLDTTLLQPDQSLALGALVTQDAVNLQARLTIIAPDGTVLADSEQDYRVMENHFFRPEVQQALTNKQGYAIRFSATIGYDMLYVAAGFPTGSLTRGVVRLSVPMSQVQANVNRVRFGVVLAVLLALVLVNGITFLITRRTLRPIYRLTNAVRRMAAGDQDVHILSTERDEVGQLTNAFNLLADNLRDTIASYQREHDRLNGVVEHLVDGVMIIDDDGRVRLANPAALRLLGYTGSQPIAVSLPSIARYPQIVALWVRYRESGLESSDLIELERPGTFTQAIFIPLGASQIGFSLLILQDLTNLHRLETIRRDFISNISHELRTPLASLKMLAETLSDGALEDPPAARQFVQRIEVEVDAMTQLVEELLELSRIESGRVPLSLVPVAVADIVQPVLERLQPQAERAEVTMNTELPTELPPVLADTERIQRALANLVHNACKFTAPGGQVVVSAQQVDAEVHIIVHDTGVGIAPDLVPRVFERFFKADKARSGGGTGLGLAIAKHIVQAHHGRIWVESTPNVGSTFTFSLPIAEKPHQPVNL
jgi:two-component system, OmpR family, phosphate regulon sensor histidine kinase PhoR